jgi:BirA family biotin operon repressor/biotin-[acetyl-CoA-carboxylase] ligase
VNGCVAVCKTVEAFGLKPRIRWANDVLVGDKKISGTLIENVCQNGNIVRSIVGIGLNVNNTLPQELDPIATTMRMELGQDLKVEAVRKTFIKYLKKKYSLVEYKSYIDWLGQTVMLKTDKEEFAAQAVDIQNDGSLLVQVDGVARRIYCGEMSLRLI